MAEINQSLIIPDFIGIYENGATEDYCDRMVNRFHALESETSSHHGAVTNMGYQNRQDYSYMFSDIDDALTAETHGFLTLSLNKYIELYPGLGMQKFSSRCVKVQRTPPKGGFHTWHAEKSYGAGSPRRTLVWMIYLNDTPEGEGTIEFIEYGKTVQPKKGTVVFFPAGWTHTHRGNPVYTQDKYIATGWYYLDGEGVED